MAIEEYEKTYLDPFGTNSYQTAGFKKKRGKVVADPTMLSAKHIQNLEASEVPEPEQISEYDTAVYDSLQMLKSHLETIIKKGKISTYSMQDGKISYRGTLVSLYVYETDKEFRKLDIYGGISKKAEDKNSVCRIMPVQKDSSIKWIGIYLKHATNT